MKNRKKIIIGGILLAVCAAAGFGLLKGVQSQKEIKDVEAAYVEKVSDLMNPGSDMGMPMRFGGVVESQETWDIQQNEEKKVAEILVEEMQEVQVGTPLFTYDTEQMENDLNQAELDLERLENGISDLKQQIAQLEKEKQEAPEEEKLSYTTQIQTAQTEQKKSEYDKKGKGIEIEKLKTDIANATVTSEVAGVVKAIHASGETDMSGNVQPFMSIVATGEYRVKGTVTEQNLSAVTEGMPVIIRSRVDEEKMWTGTCGALDLENRESQGSSMMYYGMGESQESASSYPFYVSLESSEGLILGQHVYIEMDQGQTQVREGIWIDAGFICDIETEPYVWAADEKGKMTKRPVTLGQMDENLFQYEILDGLTPEDSIAFPQETIEEGMDGL